MYIINTKNNARSEIVGKKARNLFLLNKYFPIPEFAVITTKGFKDYRKYKKITPALEHELKETLRRFFKKGFVAIRSSGTAEDLPGISFAGMYETTLNIKNIDDGIRAVIRTWNSVDSDRVNKYCESMNVSLGDMAVIIQHQLEPEKSGVMVTQSPFRINEVLIECCQGLGEKLVSGKIIPTRYRIRRNEIAEHRGGDLLVKEQVLKLVNIGKKIENIFKSPQDIEWAIEHGKIYILQSRPVLLHASIPRRRCTVWCNANVRETIPDPMSPMGWSIFDSVFFPSIFIDVFRIPITPEQYWRFRPVELISGRLYWNMNNTIAFMKSIGPIIDFIEGDKAIDPQMTTAFNAVDINNLPRPIPCLTMFRFSIVSLVRFVYYLVLGFFRYGWMSMKITKSHNAFGAIYKQLKPATELATGINNVKEWMRYVLKKFARRYFGGLFLSGFYLVLLGKLLSIRMGKNGGAIARKTIIGIVDKTGEMAIALNKLASLAKKKVNTITPESLKKLYDKDKEFHDLFDKFLCDFGHRGPAEFDIASPNWREEHDLVFNLITTAKDCEEYHIDRKTVINHMLRASKPYERFILKKLLPRIEVFSPLRENGKHVYLKAMAKIKDQLMIMENILMDQGYVNKPRDIFFLTLRDLENILARRCARADILTLITKRKNEWEMYRRAKPPDIIYESGERISASITESAILSGEPLSYGKIKARARIIKDFNDSSRLKKGEILVTHHTDPGWTPLFIVASGVIIEVGGVICHAAMVARELGIPAVVIRGATALIPEGKVVELDADEGTVKIMSNIK
ncbi:Prodigiosin synthesizing transferase PigC [subsurface metagenome]